MLQAFKIADDNYFTAAARMSHIDAVRVVDKTDSLIFIAADVTNNYNVAFRTLKTVHGRDF